MKTWSIDMIPAQCRGWVSDLRKELRAIHELYGGQTEDEMKEDPDQGKVWEFDHFDSYACNNVTLSPDGNVMAKINDDGRMWHLGTVSGKEFDGLKLSMANSSITRLVIVINGGKYKETHYDKKFDCFSVYASELPLSLTLRLG